MGQIKQIWELSETVKIHHAYLKEIVATLNQIMDKTEKLAEFTNVLCQRLNQADDDIMELARDVYKNEATEGPF